MRIKYLRRYTDLPSLIYLLSKKKITFLDPQSWDDRNDSYYLSVYKDKRDLNSVLALCFTQTPERYHHWKVFAGNSSGICIVFNRDKFLNILKEKHEEIRMGEVKYLTIDQRESIKANIGDLPFIKRKAFEDDEEYRVIYQSEKRKLSKFDIRIQLNCISEVVLSPWIHYSLSDSIKKLLKSIDGCDELIIKRSTLINNKQWKAMVL